MPCAKSCPPIDASSKDEHGPPYCRCLKIAGTSLRLAVPQTVYGGIDPAGTMLLVSIVLYFAAQNPRLIYGIVDPGRDLV